MKKRKLLTWTKAGKTRQVTILGTDKAIKSLIRNLETDAGVETYTLTDSGNAVKSE